MAEKRRLTRNERYFLFRVGGQTAVVCHCRLGAKELLERRGVRFRKLAPSSYGARLQGLVRREEPARAVDRLLVAGLIEARSCERFALLRDHVADGELRDFWGGLFESEARHHATYVRLAKEFQREEAVVARLKELAAAESAIMAEGESQPRMHS